MSNTENQPNTEALSSQESFAAPDFLNVPAKANEVVVKPDNIQGMTEDDLQAGLDFVRTENEQFTLANANADEAFEKRFAAFLSVGYRNALDLLANTGFLNVRLVKIGLTPAKDTSGLLGQIAKLQLGSWINGKWSVPSRRDERQARFYRIFKADPVKFHVGSLDQTIFDAKGRSGGILASVKPKKATVGKVEKAANLETARKATPVVKVNATLPSKIKLGTYKLALVRVTGGGFDVCTIVDGEDAVTNRVLDKWAATVAETTIVEDAA